MAPVPTPPPPPHRLTLDLLLVPYLAGGASIGGNAIVVNPTLWAMSESFQVGWKMAQKKGGVLD